MTKQSVKCLKNGLPQPFTRLRNDKNKVHILCEFLCKGVFEMKKMTSLVLVLMLLFSFVGCAEQREKPYKDLVASDIASATVTASLPNKTVQVDDIENLVSLLRDVVIYEKDNSYTDYYGQWVSFTLTMSDGTEKQANPFGDFFIIDGTGYKTKYKPSERLNNFANELLEKATDITDYEKTVSYANWSQDQKIYFACLNREQMSVCSVKHCPIFKMESKNDLENFKANYGDVLAMTQPHDEMPSFETATAKYDEKFFEENTLFVVYVTAGSGTYRFDVDSVYCDDDSFCVHIKQTNNPEVVTMDEAGWFVTVAVKDDLVSGCKSFDADLVA